jgi:hypothetical protein
LTKRDEFLRATDSNDWRTLEEIVEALDHANYWGNEPHAVDKREHAREMIAMLIFGEDAPRLNGDPTDRTLVGQHVFASTFRANESGELVRVYKTLLNLTLAEVREMAGHSTSTSGSPSTGPRRRRTDR